MASRRGLGVGQVGTAGEARTDHQHGSSRTWGAAVGVAVGAAVGVAVGAAVGVAVGAAVGAAVGVAVGVAVGADVGADSEFFRALRIFGFGHNFAGT